MPQRTPEEGLSGSGAASSGPLITSAMTQANHKPFGAELEPVVRSVCQGRLSEIHWFRTDWQRGGALTGYAKWRDDDDQEQPVVVKLPVPPGERWWFKHLQPFADVAPRLYADGETLSGYDMAWLVMQRMSHGPLSASWHGREFDLLVEAAGRFYAAADQADISGLTDQRDWSAILDHARQSVHHHSLANEQRWNKALKQARRRLKSWLTLWNDRPQDQWCHGDLHLGNAMTSRPAPDGPALLFDYAKTHLGHWVEDAIYFEHLYWHRREQLAGRKLCSMIAKQRKKTGLAVHADWPQWASVHRAFFAMGTPAMLAQAGAPPVPGEGLP